MVKPSAAHGMSTLEILLAFAVLTLSLTAVISLVYGNQTALIDMENATEALSRAQALIENEQALAASNFFAATSSSTDETVGPLTYTEVTAVSDVTPCKKVATSTISWNTDTLRPQKIELTTILSDVAGALALGGDCPTDSPAGGWTNPTRYASDTLSPEKPIALDVLDGIAYVAEDTSPYLAIADTRSAASHQASGLFLPYANGFAAGGPISALDSVNWTDPSTGERKTYVFAAMASTTSQLEVIEVTTPTAPVLRATVSLSSCVAGSFPQGWFLTVYGNRLYFVTRETAGPEFHVFDISTPSSPIELSIGSPSCRGFQLNDTVEQMQVREQVMNGATKRLAFLASDDNNQELRILDVTTPYSITEVRDVDLPGTQDGASLYLLGSKLYYGRLTVSNGPELYVFTIDNPAVNPLPVLGSQELGTDVLGIKVAGSHAFIATKKANKELQVWNIANPAAMSLIATYAAPSLVGSGIDYESDFIYATAQSSPSFQMLYSP